MLQISQVFSKGSRETPSDTDGRSGEVNLPSRRRVTWFFCKSLDVGGSMMCFYSGAAEIIEIILKVQKCKTKRYF